MESIRNYRSNCEEIRKRIETKTISDQKVSQKHWKDVQSNLKRNINLQQSNRYNETERINTAMCKISSRLQTGMQRAQSAREFTVRERSESNLKWQQSVRNMNDKKLEWETESMMSAIKRKKELQQKQERFSITQKLELSERKLKLNEKTERIEKNLKDVRKRDALQRQKLERQYKSIEEKRLDHNRSIESQKEFAKELNTLRRQDNEANRVQQKAMLDSIKERILRKQKRLIVKRARQVQVMTPPTTFDIYMQSSMQWNPNRPNISSPLNDQRVSSLNKSAVTTTGFSMKNPLADISLRNAMNSSQTNFWTNRRSRGRKSNAPANDSFQQGL